MHIKPHISKCCIYLQEDASESSARSVSRRVIENSAKSWSYLFLPRVVQEGLVVGKHSGKQ